VAKNWTFVAEMPKAPGDCINLSKVVAVCYGRRKGRAWKGEKASPRLEAVGSLSSRMLSGSHNDILKGNI
jgi:hypothetical protein